MSFNESLNLIKRKNPSVNIRTEFINQLLEYERQLFGDHEFECPECTFLNKNENIKCEICNFIFWKLI
jgi:hypothetical protein